MVKTVTYSHTNSYETLNVLQANTQNIWICFHGLGYLTTYFKKYFKNIDPEKNYFIFPQAPSKFYMGKEFKHVGASWLTRVDTQQEMGNNLNYIHKILEQENIAGDHRIVLLGYSQGVSIATRFLAQYPDKIKCLIMHSGSIPVELNEQDGIYLKNHCNRIIHIAGTLDEYASPEIEKREAIKINMLFGTQCEIYRPDIKHVVHVPLIDQIAKDLES